MLGVNVNLELTTEAVDAAVELGITWIRRDTLWSFVHPTETAFNTDVAAGGVWPLYADLQSKIAYAHSKGLKILLIAQSSPSWVVGAPRTDGGNPNFQAPLPGKRAAFAEYCHQLALLGADAIEVGNEINFTAGRGYALGPDHPRAAFPAERIDDYVLLMRAIYARVKADFPACKVGTSGLAIIGHMQIPDSNFTRALDWYTKMFASTADDRTTPISIVGSWDFANVHTYADRNISPMGPLAWNARWINQPNDAIYWHGIAHVWMIRQLLVAQGCGDIQIWSTEAGAPTSGTSIGAPPISEALQAQWVTDYCTAWFTTGSSGLSAPLSPTFFGDWTGPMFFYQWHDVSDGVIAPTTTEGFFGIVRYNRSHKPAWDVLKAAAAPPMAPTPMKARSRS